jgi:hypothetical protein
MSGVDGFKNTDSRTERRTRWNEGERILGCEWRFLPVRYPQ